MAAVALVAVDVIVTLPPGETLAGVADDPSTKLGAAVGLGDGELVAGGVVAGGVVAGTAVGDAVALEPGVPLGAAVADALGVGEGGWTVGVGVAPGPGDGALTPNEAAEASAA